MKNKKTSMLLIAGSFFLVVGCNAPQDIPTGDWQSEQGRSELTLKKDAAGDYRAIVHHRMADGYVCPVTYPVCRGTCGMYIQAEGRIYLSYSSKDSTLFLSPGGTYHLKKQE